MELSLRPNTCAPPPTTSSASTTSFTVFSALPRELRDYIWLQTFEPRIVSLFYYRSPRVRESLPGGDITARIENYSARVGLHMSDIRPDERSLNPQISHFAKDILSDDSRNKPPPGPVTLHVCRESREIALARYEQCFPAKLRAAKGTPLEVLKSTLLYIKFKESGYADPHIWLDPRRDMIFVSTESMDSSEYREPTGLTCFALTDRDTRPRFERIAVYSHSSHDRYALKHLGLYPALKEVWIFRPASRGPHRRLAEPLTFREIPFLNSDKELEAIKELFLSSTKFPWRGVYPLLEGKTWENGFPEIKILTAFEWYTNNDNKVCLRMKPGMERPEYKLEPGEALFEEWAVWRSPE